MPGSVLIIDAEEDFVSGLARGLKNHGLDASSTGDGKVGLDMAHINIPSAIILCAELPRMSGYSICAKLKKDATLKEVPLVITSAEATQETFEHHKKLKTRADEYLRKPFTADDLVDVLERYLPMTGEASVTFTGEDDAESLGLLGAADSLEIEDARLEDFQSIGLEPEKVDAVEDSALSNLSDDEVLSALGVGAPSGMTASDLQDQLAQAKAALVAEQETRRRAERDRDHALANEKAAAAQVHALTQGQSQLPSSSSSMISGSNRDLLALRKELNAKDREILELRERVTSKDRELLTEKDRQMELEDEIVRIQEEKDSVERAKIETEGRLAAAEARALELSRTAETKITELHAQIGRITAHEASLESALRDARQENARLTEDVARRQQAHEALQGEHRVVSNELSAARAEATTLREQIDRLRADVKALETKLGEVQATSASQADHIQRLSVDLADAEDRATRAFQRIREDEETRAKARKALEIAIALLQESAYTPDVPGEFDGFSALDAVDDRS